MDRDAGMSMTISFDHQNSPFFSQISKKDEQKKIAYAAGGTAVGLGTGLGVAEALKRKKIKQIKSTGVKGAKIGGLAAAGLLGTGMIARAAKAKRPHMPPPNEDSLTYRLFRGGLGVPKE